MSEAVAEKIGCVFKDPVDEPRLSDEDYRNPQWSLHHVPGFFDFADVYAGIAHAMPAGGIFVEVGVFFGKSIVFMARTAKLLGREFRIIGVDTFDGSEEHENVRVELRRHSASMRSSYDSVLARFGVEDCVETLQMRSVDASNLFEDNSVGAVYLDAAHDYDSVRSDILAWYPKVVPGGFLGGHDRDKSQVTKAVEDIFGVCAPLSWRSWVVMKEVRR